MNSNLHPTRLIDVRHPEQPYLETKPNAGAEYVALSYVWGGRNFTTTKANFEDHMHCISSGALPKTILHAIQATRLLGYRYIWIDALCIIQDDKDDLGRELPEMGDIYRCAAFTISAEGAPNAGAGLFQERDPNLYRPCTVDVSVTTERGTTAGCLTLATTCTGPNYPGVRGWVLQEEIFTSRCLRFGKQMSWKCMANEVSETRPYTDPRRAPLESRRATNEDKLRIWLLVPARMSVAPRERRFRWNQYDAWYATVEAYSTRELSSQSDKLPALSGLAKVFHQAHGSTYIGGLWQEDLQLGLAWYVACNDPRPVKNRLGEEPSWSWASVGMVRVKFRSWKASSSHMVSAGADVIKAFCAHDNQLNPYGRVEQGTLKLRLRMKRAILRYSAEYVVDRTEYSYGRYFGPDSHTMTKGEHPRFPAVVADPCSTEFIGEAALDRPIQSAPEKEGHGNGSLGSAKQGFLKKEVWCGLLHVQETTEDYRLSVFVLENSQPGAGIYRRLGLMFADGFPLGDMPLSDWQEEEISLI